MKTMILAAACAVAVSGCVSTGGDPNAGLRQFQTTVPECENEKQCSDMWDAAQLWIVQNAPMKLQTATNVVIETYNGVGSSSTNLAMRAVKSPLGNGRYRIEFTAGCQNMFGCVPTWWTAGIRFNEAVNLAGGRQVGPVILTPDAPTAIGVSTVEHKP